jgi:alpha-L-fucosidase
VGPTADGEIPPESIKLLKQVGAWMKVNGESIYGSHASPFKKLAWGRCTTKTAGEDTILYLHVLDWPADGRLTVPGLKNAVKSAGLLAGGAALAVEASVNGPVLTLPATAPDAICSTIKLLVSGKPEVEEARVSADPDGVIRLLPGDAHPVGQLREEEKSGIPNIGHWTNPGDSVSWNLRADQDGKYLVHIEAAALDAGSVLRVHGIGKLAYAIPKTGAYDSFQSAKVGEVTLRKGDKPTLTLLPVADGWHPVNLRKVELVPQP